MYPRWPKQELHKQAGKLFCDFKHDIKELLYEAKDLRETADYHDTDVDKFKLDILISEADEIFKMIEGEIHDYK